MVINVQTLIEVQYNSENLIDLILLCALHAFKKREGINIFEATLLEHVGLHDITVEAFRVKFSNALSTGSECNGEHKKSCNYFRVPDLIQRITASCTTVLEEIVREPGKIFLFPTGKVCNKLVGGV